MKNAVLQQIFDLVEEYLPDDWIQMILYIGYTSGSYSMKYYIKDKAGKYTDCFKQAGVSKVQLVRLFMNIDKILASERKDLSAKEKWSVMTMVVDADGSVNADYDYIDISENTILYEQNWKAKYLK